MTTHDMLCLTCNYYVGQRCWHVSFGLMVCILNFQVFCRIATIEFLKIKLKACDAPACMPENDDIFSSNQSLNFSW